MAIQYNENVKIAAPNPLDKRYLSDRTYLGSQLPYSAITEVNSSIILSERYTGLTVNINGIEYWYKEGVDDSNLIEKKYDTQIPESAFVTGGTNIGFFTGYTGIQTLPVVYLPDSNYIGNYYSIYNNYYRGTDGVIHVGAASDGVYRRGYVKTSLPVKSFLWNEYVGGSDLAGWILVDGNIEELVGTYQTTYTYYDGVTKFPYTGDTWISGQIYNNGSDLAIALVYGSLTTGNTISIGGPVYSHTDNNLMQLRTIKTLTPEYINIDYDEAFVYISGTTSIINGENIGGGLGVFSQKNENILEFKTLIGSGDTTITQIGDTLNIYSNSAGADTITGVTLVGSGVSISSGVINRNLPLRKLSGSGSTVVNLSGDTIIVYSTDSAVGTITGATNGLSLSGDGRSTVLGGNLICSTTINGLGSYNLNIENINEFQVNNGVTSTIFGVDKEGFIFTTTGGSVTFDDNGGLKYAGDYSNNYTDESLINKAFVCNNYLRLNQTIPQNVIGSQPIFNEGIVLGSSPSATQITGHTKGKIYYDSCYETLSANINNEINLQIGQETLRYVYNNTGSIILNGTPVYMTGVHMGGIGEPDVITVGLAIANDVLKSKVVGVSTQNIPINGYGYITVRGAINDLDTLNTFPYSGMTVGDNLYLSSTNAGQLTNIPPTTPDIEVILGQLIKKNNINGKIYVNIFPSYSLNDLTDVTVPAPSLDEVLKWNGSEWVNGTVGAVSAGAGVYFYNSTPIINSVSAPFGISNTGIGNGVQVATLSKTPITAGGTKVVTGYTTAGTTRAFTAWLYDYPIGRTVIDSGVWKSSTYIAVDSLTPGSAAASRNIYQVVPITGSTISTTGSSVNARTATISSNQFTGMYFSASTVNTDSSWLQTPNGIYQICAKINNNQVCIVVPTTYTNETSVTGNTWNKLFGGSSGIIDSVYPTYKLCEISTTQPAYYVNCTDKLGQMGFVSAVSAARTIYMTYNGSEQPAYFQTPLITLHNDLAGLQGGSGNERYHVTLDKYNVIQDTSGINTGDETKASIETKLTGEISTHYHPGYVFDSDIIVSVATGKTFGKYENGDVVPSSGKTAIEVIMMALSEALTPTVNLSSSSSNVFFGLSAKTVNLTFSYIINTLNANVASVLLEWRRGNAGAWSGLTTNTGATVYNHTIYEFNRFNTDIINYRYTVIDSAGATGQTIYNVTPQAYTAPTMSISLNGTITSPETQNIREKGNVNSSPSGTIISNRSLVDITAWTLERRYNGGSWTTLASASGLELQSVSIPSTADNTIPTNATSIEYRIGYTDEYTTGTGGNQSISFKYYSYWGFNTNTTVSESQIEAFVNKNFLSSQALTWNNINTPVGNYTYYSYPSTYSDITSIIKNGVNQDFGAWQKLSNVNVTNSYGESLDYKVWRTNATSAYSSTDDIVIS